MIYVSICIPTKDRMKILEETINSILNDNVNPEHFQIVISDNSDNNETKEYIDGFYNTNYNVKYYKNPTKGFYNSIQSLLIGDGELLKLHNDYTKFESGCFEKLVKLAIDNQIRKPLIFFPNGGLRGKNIICHSFNLFMAKCSYLTTWSSAFSIWKSDLSNLDTDPKSVDSMFPHTTLLLASKNKEYLIFNETLFKNSEVKNKGGYNIYYNFCILYLGMLKKNKRISLYTYKKIKLDMYFNFILVWYYRTIVNNNRNYTFDNTDAETHIRTAYGKVGLSCVKFLSGMKNLKDKLK